MMLIFLPMPIPTMPSYTEQQNVGLVTAVEGLYYCIVWVGSNDGGRRMRQRNRKWKGDFVCIQNCIMENNKKEKECDHCNAYLPVAFIVLEFYPQLKKKMQSFLKMCNQMINPVNFFKYFDYFHKFIGIKELLYLPFLCINLPLSFPSILLYSNTYSILL